MQINSGFGNNRSGDCASLNRNCAAELKHCRHQDDQFCFLLLWTTHCIFFKMCLSVLYLREWLIAEQYAKMEETGCDCARPRITIPNRPWNCLFFCYCVCVEQRVDHFCHCTAIAVRLPLVSAKKITPHWLPETLHQAATVFGAENMQKKKSTCMYAVFLAIWPCCQGKCAWVVHGI